MTALEDLGLSDVVPQFHPILGTLRFVHVPLEYNQTLVQCRGSLQSGEVSTSEGVVLLLQGTTVYSNYIIAIAM